MSITHSMTPPFFGGLLIKGLGAFFASLIIVSAVLDQVTIVYSPSDSLPYRTFLELKRIKPQLGQYAYFECSSQTRLSQTSLSQTSLWYGGRVIKQIVGKAGDRITYDAQGNLWVGEQKIGKAKTQARDGRRLTPIKAGIIPQGMVFMKGEHERSFDSRYEEMGLIPETALGGRVFGIV